MNTNDERSASKSTRTLPPVYVTPGHNFNPKPICIEVPAELHGSPAMFRDAILTTLTVKSNLRRYEAYLMFVKWFDYRFITPATATQKFVHAYENLGTEMNKRYLARGPLKLSRNNLWRMSGTMRTSFWSARQYADAHCIKYDFFIRYVMDYWLQSGQCGRKKARLPRPNQLFTKAAMPYAEEKWKEHCRECRFECSTLPQYRVENYAGLTAQDHHKSWLIALTKKRRPSSRPYALAKFIYEDRLLSENDVATAFDPVLLKKAKKLAEPAATPMTPMKIFDLFPACYGIPSAASEVCNKCFQRFYCERDAAKAFEVAAATSIEHVDERIRRQARERKSRERARKREAVSEAAVS